MKKIFYTVGLMGLSLWFATAEAAVSTTFASPDSASYTATVAGAILSSGSSALPGVTANFAKRNDADTPFYYGAEMGLYLQTSSLAYLVIPVLAHADYLFEFDAPIHPLVGVLAGPVFTTGGGINAVRMGLMFRPGLNVDVGERADINFEVRFGVLGTSTVVQPQLGAVFAL